MEEERITSWRKKVRRRNRERRLRDETGRREEGVWTGWQSGTASCRVKAGSGIADVGYWVLLEADGPFWV